MKSAQQTSVNFIDRVDRHQRLFFTILSALFVLLVSPDALRSQQLQDTLFVRSFILTTDVEEFEPVDTVQAFAISVDPQAVCHARIYNTTGIRTLTFRWFRNGEPYATRSVTIENSSRYRIYMSVDPEPGRWEVQLLDEQNTILARKQFSILQGTVQSD